MKTETIQLAVIGHGGMVNRWEGQQSFPIVQRIEATLDRETGIAWLNGTAFVLSGGDVQEAKRSSLSFSQQDKGHFFIVS